MSGLTHFLPFRSHAARGLSSLCLVYEWQNFRHTFQACPCHVSTTLNLSHRVRIHLRLLPPKPECFSLVICSSRPQFTVAQPRPPQWPPAASHPMPPAKSRANHDDSKSEAPNPKDKSGHGSTGHQTNGKARRIASVTGSQLREVTNVSPSTAAPPVAQDAAANPGVRLHPRRPDGQPLHHETDMDRHQLQWTSFDRNVLHAYRRVYRLNTPAAFSNEYHRWVLSQPGSIGLQSPTMARRKELRRQSKEQLATSTRKHFNALGSQENDVIVDFLHKVRSQGITKPERTFRRTEHNSAEHNR